jgi:tRNA-binding protein
MTVHHEKTLHHFRYIYNMQITWDDFSKIKMHVGTITHAEVFLEAKKPAYKLIIDFGPLGQRKSSAQITKVYSAEELVGRQVVAVLNFPPKQIANIQSECLVLGAVEGDSVILLTPEREVTNGLAIG